MSVKSKPYYWLECDACGGKSTEGSDYEAWGDTDSAIKNGRDVGWKITMDARHYCEEHELNVCDECGAYDSTPLAGERDYLCVPCSEKEAAS